jgi:hypothetical protein
LIVSWLGKRGLELRQVRLGNIPHDIGIDAKILVNQNVSHANDLGPRHSGDTPA